MSTSKGFALQFGARLRFLSTLNFRKLSAAVLLSLMVPFVASAYTLVLRDGRRIEAPSELLVTDSTVTYEAAPNISMTFMLSSIDIAATERLNGEPAGSFLQRRMKATQAAPNRTTPTTQRRATNEQPRTITNDDLRTVRREREEQEETYRREHTERGMPSPEELQRRIDEQNRQLGELARQIETERLARQTERLSNELAELNGRLAQIGAQAAQPGTYTQPVFTGGVQTFPFFYPNLFPFGFGVPGLQVILGGRFGGFRYPYNYPNHPNFPGSVFGGFGNVPGLINGLPTPGGFGAPQVAPPQLAPALPLRR